MNIFKILSLLKENPQLISKVIKEVKNTGLKNSINKIRIKLKIISNAQIEVGTMPIMNNCNNREKILFICHEAENGGASINGLFFVKSLYEKYNKEVIVLSLKGGVLENEYKKYSRFYNLAQDNFQALTNTEVINQILNDLYNEGVRKCILNTVVSCNLSKLISNHNIQQIGLIHELPDSIDFYDFNYGVKNAIKYSKNLVFANEFVRDKFVSRYQYDLDKTIIRPQGVYRKINPLADKTKNKEMLCKELDIPIDSKIVLGCGLIDLRKGVDLFNIVHYYVTTRIEQEVHFVWLGATNEYIKNWIEYDIKNLNKKRTFHFLKHKQEPEYIFTSADIFLLTSREDPFPTVALEAMDAETLVISFDNNGGIPEMLKNEFGIVVPYMDVVAMGDRIIELINKENHYKEMVTKAKQKIEEDYNYDDYVKYIYELFDEKA